MRRAPTNIFMFRCVLLVATWLHATPPLTPGTTSLGTSSSSLLQAIIENLIKAPSVTRSLSLLQLWACACVCVCMRIRVCVWPILKLTL